MRVGVIVAMDIEYRHLADALGGTTEGHFPGSNVDIVLLQCGIGKVNAAIGTLRLIQTYRPDCIVSTGLAGGIGPDVSVWDTVVAQQIAYHDVYCGPGCEQGQVQGLPTRFACDQHLVDTAVQAARGSEAGNAHCGLICTGDQFITSPEPVQTILASFPDALACDMESASIAHVCHLQQVPFISIRTISDTPARVRDHTMQWEDSLRVMSHSSFNIVKQFLQSL